MVGQEQDSAWLRSICARRWFCQHDRQQAWPHHSQRASDITVVRRHTGQDMASSDEEEEEEEGREEGDEAATHFPESPASSSRAELCRR